MEHSKPIVTEVAPLEKFYAAETYHHNYYQDNPNQPYCMAVISPKLRKFQAYLGKIKPLNRHQDRSCRAMCMYLAIETYGS